MSNQKTVYQCGWENYYVGTTLAQESPREPGVFLIPAGATEVAPKPPKKPNLWPQFNWETQQWVNVDVSKIDVEVEKLKQGAPSVMPWLT